MLRIKLLLSSVIFCLISCSDNENASVETEPKKTVIDHQIQALEKAKGVEQQIMDAAEQQQKLIEAQEY